jgi:hypothetical protein
MRDGGKELCELTSEGEAEHDQRRTEEEYQPDAEKKSQRVTISCPRRAHGVRSRVGLFERRPEDPEIRLQPEKDLPPRLPEEMEAGKYNQGSDDAEQLLHNQPPCPALRLSTAAFGNSLGAGSSSAVCAAHARPSVCRQVWMIR